MKGIEVKVKIGKYIAALYDKRDDKLMCYLYHFSPEPKFGDNASKALKCLSIESAHGIATNLLKNSDYFITYFPDGFQSEHVMVKVFDYEPYMRTIKIKRLKDKTNKKNHNTL